MLCVTDDEYSDSDIAVHTGAYANPRPHVQADLFRLGREIQRILMQEPGYTVNLCKIREKYEMLYGKPLDKLGYSKLVDCAYALPDPITTRNVRPNGIALRLTRPMADTCSAFQYGKCPNTPEECKYEHECNLCGYPTHGTSLCTQDGAPDTKPVQSYSHCCLRSKCVGDIHNPDITIQAADETLLAEMSIPKGIPTKDILMVQQNYGDPPQFSNSKLECIKDNPRRPIRPSNPPPRIDETTRKVRAFYGHFLSWMSHRNPNSEGWPTNRDEFSFDWETYLSGNRPSRVTVVTIVDFAPCSTLLWLYKEAGVVILQNATDKDDVVNVIQNETNLVWNHEKIAQFINDTGSVPSPQRRWSGSTSEWGTVSNYKTSHDNDQSRIGWDQPDPPAHNRMSQQWSDEPQTTQDSRIEGTVPTADQRVLFTLSRETSESADPVSQESRPGSFVVRATSDSYSESITSKIPIPTMRSDLADDDDSDDDDDGPSGRGHPPRVWASSWRPRQSEMAAPVVPSSLLAENLPQRESDYEDDIAMLETGRNIKECMEENGFEDGALIDDGDESDEDGQGAIDEYEEGAIDEHEQGAIDEDEEGAIDEDEEEGAIDEDEDGAIDEDDFVEEPAPERQGMFQDVIAPNTFQDDYSKSHKKELFGGNSVGAADDADENGGDVEEYSSSSESMNSEAAAYDVYNPTSDIISPEVVIDHMNQLAAEYASESSSDDEDKECDSFNGFLRPIAGVSTERQETGRHISDQTENPVQDWNAPDSRKNGITSHSVLELFGKASPEKCLPAYPFLADLSPSSASNPLSSTETPFMSAHSGPESSENPILSPLAPAFTPPVPKKLEADAPSFVPTQSKETLDEDHPPSLLSQRIVVGDASIGKNYRRHAPRNNTIVSRNVLPAFAFSPDVSESQILSDLQRLGLASGSSPTMSWNSDRVKELDSLSKAPVSRPSSNNFVAESVSMQHVQNEMFLKKLLFQAINGIGPSGSDELDGFTNECVRLQNAGVEAVVSGMRSLWVPSRNCPSPNQGVIRYRDGDARQFGQIAE